jgi:arylformamidase
MSANPLAGARDITIHVRPGMTLYPGECETEKEMHYEPGPGQPMTCSHWRMTAHAGTHLDAPSHFVPGARNIDSYTPEELSFRAYVCTADPRERDVSAFLVDRHAKAIAECDAVLFRTQPKRGWEDAPFDTHHPAISHDAGRILAGFANLKLIGIDYFSVEPYGAEPAHTHLAILGAGMLILEAINLDGIPDGFHRLVCLPILLKDSEAAPTRAILLPDSRE